MIRRKFMKYAPKEHSDEKVKKTLEKHNVPTFEGKEPAKFSQFGNIAKDIAAKSRKTFTTPDGGQVAPADKTFSWQQKAVYGGAETGVSKGDPRNPYAVSQPKGNPYAMGQSMGQSNPYGGGGQVGSSASSTVASNPYQASKPSAKSTSTSLNTDYASTASPYSTSTAVNYGEGLKAPESGAHYGDMGNGGGNPYGGSYNNYGGYGDEDELGAVPAAPAAPAARNVSAAPMNDFGEGYPPSGDLSGPAVSSAAASAGIGSAAPPTAFGEPLSRVRTNQSTSTTVAARQELFGSAPRRLAPDASEFDELNRTHTELEEYDELLSTSRNLDRPQFTSSLPSAIPEENLEPEDELNQLPSEFQRPADMSMPGNEPEYGGGGGADMGYRSGQQLFEDSEDEDVDYVKREIRQTKQESVESTRRALQIAAEAETSGRNAMGMLGDQGERLGNSAKTVALGNVQARVAERNADELQRLNRSIFIPNVSNPFNSRRRNQMREQKLKCEREFDQMERDYLETQQREAEQRVADGLNSAGYGYSETALRAKQRMNRDNPERKMYQFEADSDDEALEDELDQNLDGISDAAKRLHGLSLKIRDEVTDQNRRIEEMGGRVDDLDYSLHKSTAKMATIN